MPLLGLGKIPGRSLEKALGLLGPHSFCRQPMLDGRSGLNLHKDNRATIIGNEVNLATSGTKIPFHDPPP